MSLFIGNSSFHLKLPATIFADKIGKTTKNHLISLNMQDHGKHFSPGCLPFTSNPTLAGIRLLTSQCSNSKTSIHPYIWNLYPRCWIGHVIIRWNRLNYLIFGGWCKFPPHFLISILHQILRIDGFLMLFHPKPANKQFLITFFPF